MNKTQRRFKRRTVIVTVGLLLPFPAVLQRVWHLQTAQGEQFKTLAEQNRIHLRPLQPQRGKITDSTGTLLAHDITAYRLVIIPEQTPDPHQTLEQLATLIPLSRRRIERTLLEIRQKPRFYPHIITKSLSFNDLARVQVNLPQLPGVDLLSIYTREYPIAEPFSHIIGYTGFSAEKIKLESGRFWPGEYPVGREGLEKTLDDTLRGQPGARQIETNAFGREVRTINATPATSGRTMQLTIDHRLQQTTYETLREHIEGAAVVIDLRSGAIKAMVSYPSYDINRFTEGIDPDYWSELRQASTHPLINRSLQGQYAPGSTFKMVVAAAAINEGLINPEKQITCRGHIDLGDRRFHCWKRHGTLNLVQSIASSCDIYFYELGRRLGIDKIAHYAKLFGLGQRYLWELPEEEGLVPTEAWKRKTRNEAWTGGETIISAIGQGFLLATPLQLAVMAGRMATGSTVNPYLLQGHHAAISPQPIPISKEAMAIIQQGMWGCVNDSQHATARNAKLQSIVVAGKTGTSQVISKRFGEDYEIEDIPRDQRAHGLFVAYAPFDNPRYAVSVVLEHAGSGGRFAAPVAQKILAQAFALEEGASS